MADRLSGADEAFSAWLRALEQRHLRDLRLAEVTRALRALSSLYVERRGPGGPRAALDSAGKRAAFALFYAPLHWLITRHIVRALGAADGRIDLIVDLGCGTGAAGAAWALEAGDRPNVVGIDRHPWAVAEARRTYKTLGLRGRATRADVARQRLPGRHGAVLAAFALNELSGAVPEKVLERLLAAALRGARVLAIEPVAGFVAPWWDDWAARVVAAGGRADVWRVTSELPDLIRRLDRAAGLDHQTLAARSLWMRGDEGAGSQLPANGGR